MPGGRGAKSGRGGYQAPDAPAPVSGPGALSARTDGGPGSAKQPVRPIPTGDGPQGTRAASVQQQQAAPMPVAPPVPAAAVAPPPAPAAAGTPIQPGALTPLTAPTTRPGEPIQHGLPIGPGAGPEVLGLPPAGSLADTLRAAAEASGSTSLMLLADRAQAMGQ